MATITTLASNETGADSRTIINTNFSNLNNDKIEDISGSPLSELSDVTITSIAPGEILKWNGSAWVNNTLAEAGIAASGANSDITSLSGLSTALSVGQGGTGATSLTDGGILLGSGSGAITAMSVLSDGNVVIGDGTTDPTTLAAFTSSTGTLKHEYGGLELDISAVAIGDVLAGTGTGTMGLVTASGKSDGDVLTLQADGTADWETPSGGGGTMEQLINLSSNNSLDTHRVVTSFADGSTTTAAFSFYVPSDVSSISSIKLVWYSSAASGNMYWNLVTKAAASGEAFALHSDGGDNQTSATGGSDVINVTTVPTDQYNLVNPGDFVGMTMERLGGNGSDTLNAVVKVIGFLVTFA